MKELIKLANKIQNEELRKKVIDFLNNPELSHQDFKKYSKEDIKKTKAIFTVTNLGTVERNLLEHIIALTELCTHVADNFKKNFGLELNKDYLIAAAVLHDLMKIYEWKQTPQGTSHTGIPLDHTMLGVAELYQRRFPEQVIHIIASHFGEGGPTPPRSFEALIFHHLDSMLSIIEAHIAAMQQPKKQYILIDEEALKAISKEGEEEKE